MSSYRNNPEANRVAFRDDWFRTGDLGRLDSDGFLFVTGRLKEIINRGGEKVLPGEIEDALRAHPAVAEVAAFGIAHATLGEEAAAAVVARPGMATSEPELRRFAAERIADFKVPRRVVFMDAIPKGPTGKPARAELAEQFQRGTDAVRDVSGAANETETGLAGIWHGFSKSNAPASETISLNWAAIRSHWPSCWRKRRSIWFPKRGRSSSRAPLSKRWRGS